MTENWQTDGILVTLGALFLVGLAADMLGRRTRLPRVTLLLICGLAVGKSGFDLIPAEVRALYDVVAVVALTMVAFLLGGDLRLPALRAHGPAILVISLSVVIGTFAAVTLGLWAVGVPLAAALVLGAIATATDPAATLDVIRQTGTRGAFAERIKGIVAIDDGWGLLVFSLALVAAQGIGAASAGEDTGHGLAALREIALSIGLGTALGVPAAYLTGRLKQGEPQRMEALGVVFLTAGLALLLDLSYLMAGMTAGILVANLAKHHTVAFHELESFQWPFMVIFFILAGATADLAALWIIGPVGAVFVLARVGGRIIGGWGGSALSGDPRAVRPLYGAALMPQAGVAIGMALVAVASLPDMRNIILPVTIGATILFEIVGPVLTGWAIARADRHEDAKTLSGTSGNSV